jgi:hypothetical protein
MMDAGLRRHDAVRSDKAILGSPAVGPRVSRLRYGHYIFGELSA